MRNVFKILTVVGIIVTAILLLSAFIPSVLTGKISEMSGTLYFYSIASLAITTVLFFIVESTNTPTDTGETPCESNDNPEYILCAAIWYKELPLKDSDISSARGMSPYNIDKGIVLCGWRHGNVIAQLKSIAGLRTVSIGPDHVGESVQGFLTSKNRFVDRREAAKIAWDRGQIKDEGRSNPNILYSEDIY